MPITNPDEFTRAPHFLPGFGTCTCGVDLETEGNVEAFFPQGSGGGTSEPIPREDTYATITEVFTTDNGSLAEVILNDDCAFVSDAEPTFVCAHCHAPTSIQPDWCWY